MLGKTDPDDVAKHCTTDLETFRSEEGPFVAGIVELVILVFGEQQVQDPTIRRSSPPT